MNHTKSDIIHAFWDLLDERPYNKITVKDIVERCQVNRNTFYYHFHDIPELLEETIKSDVDSILQTYSKFGSPADCLVPLVEHSLKRKKAILHIYRSVKRDIFQSQLERMILYTVMEYVDTFTIDLPFSQEDKELLIRFYKCTFLGISLDWIGSGMDYDLLKSVARVAELLEASGQPTFLQSIKFTEQNL